MSITFVIGHKSPDLDSAVAAFAYARLKNTLESVEKYEPRLAGQANRETVHAFGKFGFALPAVLDSAAGAELVLVDHNEATQTVDGAAEAKIIEVLDHHKIDFRYGDPIMFRVLPWGSSASIVYDLYRQSGIAVDPQLAGLLLSAVLVDTVITKSPTTTEADKGIIAELARIAGIADWQAYGLELFKIRSSVSELKAEEIIKSDFKDFKTAEGMIGIGQVETVDLGEYDARSEEILAALKTIKEAGGYHTALLFITDIMKEGSRFYVATADRAKVEAALGATLDKDQVYIDGIISRKKQVAPKFIEIFGS